jgi:hypothetical protein
MALVFGSGSRLSALAAPRLIDTHVCKLLNGDLAVGFEGLNSEEVATLIDCAIKIEQARTGEVLSPTDYGDRFSGLDLKP